MPVPLARFTEAPTLDALAELACEIAAEMACADSESVLEDAASPKTHLSEAVSPTVPQARCE
jgi:hypothetical protein